jgi:uncharacterized protein (TIGR02996 family)
MSNPTFTDEDRAFLRVLLDVPEDRNTWLVYADWLDDRGDPRAEFLRLSVERSLLTEHDPARPAVEARLRQLRAELDPNWMMMFDDAPIGNCPRAGWRTVRCPMRRWDGLAATDVPDIRLCHECRRPVFYCHSVEEAREFTTSAQCVAFSTRIPPESLPPEALPPEAPLTGPDSDEFDLLLDVAELEDEPPAPPSPPARPWWRFW